MGEVRWPAEWMRGTLTLAVLGTLRDGPTYGYAITSALEQAGLGRVPGGTIYPLLGRLERDGLVTSSWVAGDGGPGRKFFEMTPAGTELLGELSERWQTFSMLVTTLATVGPPDRS